MSRKKHCYVTVNGGQTYAVPWYNTPTGSGAWTHTALDWYTTGVNGTTITSNGWDDVCEWVSQLDVLEIVNGRISVPRRQLEVALPDGSTIKVDEQGNYELVDKDAKVTYRAHRNREFNPFANAGDLIAQFIDDVAKIVPEITKQEMGNLPLNLFVHWLILGAAERDQDPAPKGVAPITRRRLTGGRPRCALPSCRRFVRTTAARAGFLYCDANHASHHAALLAGT